MNKEDPYRDQAERLRKKIVKSEEPEDMLEEESESTPSRSRFQREKAKNKKRKFKYPLIRVLALFFILMPITIFGIYNYINSHEKSGSTQAGNPSSFETIGFEEKEQAKEKDTKIEVREVAAGEKETPEEKKKQGSSSIPAVKNPAKGDAEVKGSTSSNKKQEDKQREDKEQVNKEETERPKENQKEETKDEPKEENREQPKQETKSETSNVYHTVKPNETIYRIAMNYYQSPSGVEIIKKANNLQSNDIQVGQKLVIPKN